MLNENDLFIDNIGYIKTEILHIFGFFLANKFKLILYTLIITLICIILIYKSYDQYESKITLLLPPNSNLSYKQEEINDDKNIDTNDSDNDLKSTNFLKNTNNFKIYVEFLKSNSISKKLINKNNLIKIFNVDNIDDAIKILDLNTSIYNSNNFIEITVTTNNSKLSQEISKAYIIELANLINQVNFENNEKVKNSLIIEINRVKTQLKESLELLKELKIKYKITDLNIEEKLLLQSSISLEENIIDYESNISSLENIYTEDNVNILGLKAKTELLRKELDNLKTSKNDSIPEKYFAIKDINLSIEVLDKIYILLNNKIEMLNLTEKSLTLKLIDEDVSVNKTPYYNKIQKIIGTIIMAIFISINFIFIEFMYKHKID